MNLTSFKAYINSKMLHRTDDCDKEFPTIVERGAKNYHCLNHFWMKICGLSKGVKLHTYDFSMLQETKHATNVEVEVEV